MQYTVKKLKEFLQDVPNDAVVVIRDKSKKTKFRNATPRKLKINQTTSGDYDAFSDSAFSKTVTAIIFD